MNLIASTMIDKYIENMREKVIEIERTTLLDSEYYGRAYSVLRFISGPL